jgi:hypothetical protein
MIDRQPVVGASKQAPLPTACRIGNMKDANVFGGVQLPREVVTVHLRALGGVRRKLMNHLQDAHLGRFRI